MNPTLVSGFTLCAFFASITVPANGDQGPSLSATKQFLLEYLPRRVVTGDAFKTSLQNGEWSFQGDGCKIRFAEKTTFINHPYIADYVPKTIYEVEVFPATGEFDLNGTNSPDGSEPVWFTGVGTADFRNVAIGRIAVVRSDETTVLSFGGTLEWDVPFEDSTTAERVSHALRHLATLCGVKAEPF